MQGEAPKEIMAFFAAMQEEDWEEVAAIGTGLYMIGENRNADDVPAELREQAYQSCLVAAKNGALMRPELNPLNPPAIQRIDEITVPCFFIVGDYDHPEILRASQVMGEAISNSQHLLIPNTAHFPNMEQAKLFNDAVLDFLARA